MYIKNIIIVAIIDIMIYNNKKKRKKKTMNKTQLVKAVYQKLSEKEDTYLTQNNVANVVNMTLNMMKSNLIEGTDTGISGFVKLSREERKARTYRNPKNGEVIKKAKGFRPKAKFSSVFKKALNTKKATSKTSKETGK